MFFKEIFLDAHLSKAKCYVIRIEFQVSGNQNIHSFLWIVNAPILSEKTIEFYTEWLDQMISAELQDKSSKPTMFELVKNFQLHRHSKTFQKFSNRKSRFNFCRFFTERTIVAKLLSERLTEHEKAEIMFVRSTILNKVKANIDRIEFVKYNFYDKTRDDFEHVGSINCISNQLGIFEEDYYNALSISDDNDFQVHLKRLPNSCFANNYFRTGLLPWEANLDIQPVFKRCLIHVYIFIYNR